MQHVLTNHAKDWATKLEDKMEVIRVKGWKKMGDRLHKAMYLFGTRDPNKGEIGQGGSDITVAFG
jgi:hypothetical protein